MKIGSLLGRCTAYAWAAPNTAIGLVAGALMLCLGGRARRVRGVLEFSGGYPGRLAAGLPLPLRFTAITLGHCVLGVDDAALNAAREHELVHVRQYELWGPLFVPAYLASSAWQLVIGRRAYVDNHFERQARDRTSDEGRLLFAEDAAAPISRRNVGHSM